MKRIAIIPARGGSKRLPRKNILHFHGRPIIAYAMDAAVRSGCFDRILVSTENQEIAAIVENHGVEVAWRPVNLAGDTVGVVDVCVDLLHREAAAGNNYDEFCCLYPTAPLRFADDIKAVVSLLDQECMFAMAVTTYDLPPWQALKREGAVLMPMWPELITKRSQDIPQLLVDNGSTYAVNVKVFLREHTFYGQGLRGHVMPRSRSVDIDTAEDLTLAEHFYNEVVEK